MFKKSLPLILSVFFCFCGGCAVNPISGEGRLMLLSEEQDLAIGRQYSREIEKEMGGAIPDTILQNYVNSVGQKVGAVSHRPDLEYQFTALEDKTANAFALPGGYIFITRGMLEHLETESQLAAIISHEIVHVVARHASEAMSREIGIDILLSLAVPEDTSKGVLTAVDLTRQIIGLRYSRDDEREGDIAGMDYMVRAGYDPYGMVETMEMLERQEKVRGIEFLSTHPSPENRVSYLRDNIELRYLDTSLLRIGREDYFRNVLSRLR